jgi:uncharacterized protein
VELEKTLTVAAPRERVWALLLDPKIMAGCVPGTQSVDVLSDVEYLAEIKVKISFIAARFKVKTTIVESRSPEYLRIEGTGEDRTVASTMTQTSELFLTDLGGGTTELRIKARTEVLGRLGSFGLSVMRTKADRMWDEFGANFSAIAVQPGENVAGTDTAKPAAAGAPVFAPAQDRPGAAADEPSALPASVASSPGQHATAAASAAVSHPMDSKPKARWWQRLVGRDVSGARTLNGVCGKGALGQQRLATDIYVELHRRDGVVKILWPASAAAEAARWLKEIS